MKRTVKIVTVLVLLAIILAIIGLPTEAAPDEESIISSISFQEMAAHSIDVAYAEWELQQDLRKSAPYDCISLEDELQIYLEERCVEYDLDFFIMASLMFSESSFRTGVMGDKKIGGSYGLFQINNCWWDEMSKKGLDVFEPKDNIEIGLIIFSEYLGMADGDYEKAIQYYKCGPSRGKKLWNQGKKLSTIKGIINRAEEWRNE